MDFLSSQKAVPFYARIVSTGKSLPSRILTNDELSKTVDTSDEWIVARTGIKERRIANESDTSSHLGCQAAQEALIKANKKSSEIDLIIVATTTPDHIFPSVASRIQFLLKAHNAFAFDVQAVCSGFLYALSVAEHYIKAGTAKNVLVIGVDIMSRLLDWTDRSTCVLFGDGAGACLLEASEQPGIIKTILHTDGSCYDVLYVQSPLQETDGRSLKKPHLVMNGRELYKKAVPRMQEVILELLRETNVSIGDIAYFVPHQANVRIIQSVAEGLSFPMDRVGLTLDRYANTSAASIPITLDEAFSMQKVKKGDLVLFAAVGAGLAWGASLAIV